MNEKNDIAMQNLGDLLRARFPYIYISTWEEQRVEKFIEDTVSNEKIIKTVRKLFVWTQTKGFICKQDNTVYAETIQPIKAIEFIENCQEHAIFIMKDFHVYFGAEGRAEYTIIRELRDIIPKLKASNAKKNVIFISPEQVLPHDMQKEIAIFDFPLPTELEIHEVLDMLISENGLDIGKLSEQDKQKLVRAALGLTLQEAENAFARAIVNDGKLTINDINIILDEKNQGFWNLFQAIQK